MKLAHQEVGSRRAPGPKLVAVLLLASSACAEEPTACNAYACSTAVEIGALVACPEASASFDVTLCHGQDCAEGTLVWAEGEGPACTDNLVETQRDPGFFETRYVCAERADQSLALRGTIDFGREGLPVVKEFRLRVVDATSGEVLVDETTTGAFEPGAGYDHCHECLWASMELEAAGEACTAAPPAM